ncbi:MAG: DNA polymerase III subunit delta' [Clostridia bacterium]|nr:DNA polymerase III subunit delta' [Clostridia bacterium]
MIFPLIGNEGVKDSVIGMLSSGRIPHAILIEGEAGCGKSELARFICKGIICRKNNRPCGDCSGCRHFESGNHPDVLLVSPAKERKTVSVNQIREIIADAAILPQESDRKVFIIDPADIITPQAQNALLKVLEEPPESVVFILTAVSKNNLLSTIVSRCTVLTLGQPEKSAAIEYISSVSKKETEIIKEALNASHGSIGGALNILKRKSATKSSDLADSFLNAVKSGNRYELMRVVLPLEKDRAKTLDFYNELEYKVVLCLRECNSPTLVKRYDRIYDVITEHKRLLKSNVNISLLTSLLAIETTER